MMAVCAGAAAVAGSMMIFCAGASLAFGKRFSAANTLPALVFAAARAQGF